MEIGAANRGRIIALSFRFLMFLNGIFFFFSIWRPVVVFLPIPSI